MYRSCKEIKEKYVKIDIKYSTLNGFLQKISWIFVYKHGVIILKKICT